MSGQRGLNPSPVMAKDRDLTSKSEAVNLLVNFLCCKCSFCYRVATEERRNSQLLSQLHRNLKNVKDVSCVGHLSSVNLVTNVPTVAIDLPVGARLPQFWKKMGIPGGESQGSNSTTPSSSG